MKKCKCGKEIDKSFEVCYKCYQEQNKQADKQTNEGLDLSKQVEIQIWVLGIIFILGVILGAVIW